MTLVDDIGNKSAGQLIRSDDWNTLVAAVVALDERVTGELAALKIDLQGQIDELSGNLTSLQSAVATLTSQVEPLLQTFRVTLTSVRVNYTIGELAELSATVTSLSGAPATDRPWVDFVTTWGNFRPVPGFESLGGTGNRTISVRANSQGVARVLLRSDHVFSFSAEEEDQVVGSLATKPAGTSKSVAELILESSTPMEAKESGVYRVMSQEYRREDTHSVRNYTDAYYLKDPALVTGKIKPGMVDQMRTNWRDYRATVMAFAKVDSDPRTPDHSRGVNSMQITFRDWIGPWVVLDVIDELEIDKDLRRIKDELVPTFREKYEVTVDLFKEKVDDLVKDKGVIGKLQTYRTISKALGQIESPQPYLPQLTDAMQKAIGIQQTLETAQAGALGLEDGQVAFDVFSDAATRADTNVAGVLGEVDAIKSQVEQVGTQFSQLDGQLEGLATQVGSLDTQTKGALQAFGTQLQNFQTETKQDIGALSQKTSSFDESIGDLNVTVGRLDERTKELNTRGVKVEQDLGFVKTQIQDFQGVDTGKFSVVETRVQEMLGDIAGLKRQVPGG